MHNKLDSLGVKLLFVIFSWEGMVIYCHCCRFSVHYLYVLYILLFFSAYILKPEPVRFRRKNCQIDDVFVGQYVTFAKEKTTGDIYAWGLNNYYQLGMHIVVFNHSRIMSLRNNYSKILNTV